MLAGTLSRAYAPADLTDESTQFTEELATLIDGEQLQELRAVASQRTLDAIYAAPSADDEYKKLKHQIVGGWPAAPDAVPSELRQYTTFADELTVSSGLVYKGNRVVIPRGARNDIFEPHRRQRQYQALTRGRVFPQHNICVRYQNGQQKEPLMSHPALSRPRRKVGTDIFFPWTGLSHYSRLFIGLLRGRPPAIKESSGYHLRAPPTVTTIVTSGHE